MLNTVIKKTYILRGDLPVLQEVLSERYYPFPVEVVMPLFPKQFVTFICVSDSADNLCCCQILFSMR